MKKRTNVHLLNPIEKKEEDNVMSELFSSTNNAISFEVIISFAFSFIDLLLLSKLMSTSDQSLSPDNRLTNIHSRNSSKTLKCPKCKID